MVPRNINKVLIISWKQFINDIHNLADETVSKESIMQYIDDVLASRPRSQNHGSTILRPGDSNNQELNNELFLQGDTKVKEKINDPNSKTEIDPARQWSVFFNE